MATAAAASTASSIDQSSKSSFLTGLFRTSSRETPATSSSSAEPSDSERPPLGKKEGSLWSRRRMSGKRNDRERKESKRELLSSTFSKDKVKGAVAVCRGTTLQLARAGLLTCCVQG